GAGVIAELEGRKILVGNEALLRNHGAGQDAPTPTPPVILRHSEGSTFGGESARSFGVPQDDVHPNREGGESLAASAEVAVATPPSDPVPAHNSGATFVHVATSTVAGGIERLGTIVLADELKPDSIAAIAALQQLKLRTVLLTGDNRAAAESVARHVGIADVHAEVKPAEKAAVIEALTNRKARAEYERSLPEMWAEARRKGLRMRLIAPPVYLVAMVGDGINDAPALATADLGIAIGGGSDIAKEAGDIVLISGSLTGVSAAIQLSRATMRKIRQNLFLAFIYNVIAIPIAAFGLLNPIVAAAAMALSDVTVIGNALLLRWKRID